MTPRPVSIQEIAVIRATLEKGPVQACLPATVESIPSLVVVGKCECGCATVHFAEPPGFVAHARLVGDAVGRTGGGALVGVIVWGTPDAIVGLEIHTLGEEVGELPVPETIVPYDEGAG